MIRIKICGLRRPEDIDMVNRYRPDLAGFIIDFPKSFRSISPDRVRELAGGLDRKHVHPVGVFVDADLEMAAGLLKDGTLAMAQLHGHESEEYIRQLKAETGKPVIKAFQIRDKEDIHRALASSADYILLDQGQGSGRSFDWGLVPPIGRPWLLAGGLNAGNIKEAADRLHPWGVDLWSAVETDRVKDPRKVEQIIQIVRNI